TDRQGWRPGVDHDLYLNVGSHKGSRNIGTDDDNEAYTIKNVGFDDQGRTLTQVSAFGRTNTYADVRHIYANFGDGNDQLYIDPSVTVPLTVNMGAGDDAIDDGATPTGATVLNGGAGDDFIRYAGTAAAGVVTIHGDCDNLTGTIDGTGCTSTTADGRDYITLAGGSATVYGDGEDDTIIGSTFADTLVGGAGSDDITGGGGIDALYGGDYGTTSTGTDGSDKYTLQLSGLGSTIDGGGNADDFAVISDSGGDDTVSFTTVTGGLNISSMTKTGGGFTDPTVTRLVNVRNVTFFAGFGRDTIGVYDLRGSGVTSLELGLGAQQTVTGFTTAPNPGGGTIQIPTTTRVEDNAKDVVGIFSTDPLASSSSDNDTYTLTSDAPDLTSGKFTKVRVNRSIGGVSQYDVVLSGMRRTGGENDTLSICTGTTNSSGVCTDTGNDTVDASGLGTSEDLTYYPNPSDTTHTATAHITSQDLVAVQISTAGGNDRLIGSPYADFLDSGLGNDTVTGGAGLDTFADAGGNDTLVEQFDSDMALFDSTFVVGTVLADNGGPFGTGAQPTEAQLEQAMRANNPNLVFGSKGDHWSSDSVVENLGGIFENATLAGGDG
ncbi:MAG TPA: calcium-binding protein, partial [Mycobacteriales bacterium]|nr:calcium-binding protein [Mycobacteriales bacterium]